MFHVSQRTDRWFQADRLTVAPASWSLRSAVTRHRVLLRKDADVVPCSPLHRGGRDDLLVWMRDRRRSAGFAIASRGPSGRWRVGARIPLEDVSGLEPGGHFQPPDRLWFAAADRHGMMCIFQADVAAGGACTGVQAALAPTLHSEREGLATPRVLANGDATYMWYVGRTGGRGAVHLALTGDGRDWRKIGPVLSPGPPGSPDCLGLSAPWVYRDGSTYRMLYEGLPSRAILAASSSDGIAWSKEGYVLFPGAPSEADACEVAYPVLMRIGGGEHLVYAGTDCEGHSIIMQIALVGPLVPLDSGVRVTSGLVRAVECMVDDSQSTCPDINVEFAARLRREGFVPGVVRALERVAGDESLEPSEPDVSSLAILRGDSPKSASLSAEAPCIRVGAWTVERMPKASTPIYRLATRRRTLVAKLGRLDYFSCRAFDQTGVWLGSGRVGVPSASLVHVRDQAVLVSQEAKGRPLRDVLGDPREWPRASAAICEAFSADIASSLRAYSPEVIDFSTAVPNVLLQKLGRLAELLTEAWEAQARVCIRDLVIDVQLTDAIAAAQRAIRERPQWLAFGQGDFRFDHTFWDGRRLTVIDLEFSGWYDIDWVAHGIVFTPTWTCNPEFDAQISDAGDLRVSFADDTVPGRAALHALAVLGRLSTLPIAPGRVLAYNLGFLAFIVDYMWGIDRAEARRFFWTQLALLAWVYGSQVRRGAPRADLAVQTLVTLLDARAVAMDRPPAS